MPELICDPIVSRASVDPFLQTLRLLDGERPVAQSRWISGYEPSEGVAQIVELVVRPNHRRQGHGRHLMEALTHQCAEHFKLRKSRLRRLWLAVDQKRHVNARSFLMKFTFTHVGTVQEVLKDQDLLIYMRTFD